MTEALRELIAAVEAADRGGVARAAAKVFPTDFANRQRYMSAIEADEGDLNAARSLHEAVLPLWGWEVNRKSAVVQGPDGQRFFGQDWETSKPHPARNWLLAILRAALSEAEG